MSDVALLWFECRNPECGFIGKLDQKAYNKGKIRSIKEVDKRPRSFMRYVEGVRKYLPDGSIIFLSDKYGDIWLYDAGDYHNVNSWIYPIVDKELCGVCIRKINNTTALFPNGAMQ